MGRLDVEHGAEVAVDRTVDVLLHVAVRDRGAGRELGRERSPCGVETVGGLDPIDDAEFESGRHVDAFGQVVQLLGLGGTDELGEEPGAAVVAGEADLGERGGDDGGVDRDAHVAGERERQTGARRRAGQHGQRRLGHLEQASGRVAVAQPLAVHARVPRRSPAPGTATLGETLDVATRAERASRPGQDDTPDRIVGLGVRESGAEAGQHAVGHRIAALGTVHGDHGDAVVVDRVPQVFAAGVEPGLAGFG
jgi:hypothetical protein